MESLVAVFALSFFHSRGKMRLLFLKRRQARWNHCSQVGFAEVWAWQGSRAQQKVSNRPSPFLPYL